MDNIANTIDAPVEINICKHTQEKSIINDHKSHFGTKCITDEWYKTKIEVKTKLLSNFPINILYSSRLCYI